MPYAHGVVAVSGARSRALPRALVALVAVFLAVAGCAPTPSSDAVAPGEYTIAVTLSGGSGKATVQSPTKLVVTADQLTAEVVWSSPYYTWMEVGGTRYTPVSAQGEDSTFEIPVTLDVDIPVTAETTAMSKPHVIDYTLRLNSSTLESSP